MTVRAPTEIGGGEEGGRAQKIKHSSALMELESGLN